MSRTRISLSSLAFASLVAGFAGTAGARECGTPTPVGSSAKCHAPRDCNSGHTIDLGSFQIGGGGQSASEACCRVLEFIPAHNEKGANPEYELAQEMVSGWTMVGECKPAMISIAGFISLPSGQRYCEYDTKLPTTIVSYSSDGYCEQPGDD